MIQYDDEPSILPTPKIMVVGFTEDQEGQDIKDEDLVRPSNHHWCTQGGDETKIMETEEQGKVPVIRKLPTMLQEWTIWQVLQ